MGLFLSYGVVAQDSTSRAPKIIHTHTGPIKVEQLASLSEPWGMDWLPDGRLLITEKPGRLRIYAAGKLSAPLAGLPKIEYHNRAAC